MQYGNINQRAQSNAIAEHCRESQITTQKPVKTAIYSLVKENINFRDLNCTVTWEWSALTVCRYAAEVISFFLIFV